MGRCPSSCGSWQLRVLAAASCSCSSWCARRLSAALPAQSAAHLEPAAARRRAWLAASALAAASPTRLGVG
eukprot:6967856-Pyramimonas_sp.AAC.1